MFFDCLGHVLIFFHFFFTFFIQKFEYLIYCTYIESSNNYKTTKKQKNEKRIN